MVRWRDRIVGTLKLVLGALAGDKRLERAGRRHLLAAAAVVDEASADLRAVIVPITRAPRRRVRAMKRARPSRR